MLLESQGHSGSSKLRMQLTNRVGSFQIQLERVAVFFDSVDGNRCEAESFDVGNRGSSGEHSSELLDAMIARWSLMHR